MGGHRNGYLLYIRAGIGSCLGIAAEVDCFLSARAGKVIVPLCLHAELLQSRVALTTSTRYLGTASRLVTADQAF